MAKLQLALFAIVAGSAAGMTGQGQATTLNVAQLGIDPSFSGGTGPFDETVTKPGHIDLFGAAQDDGGPLGIISKGNGQVSIGGVDVPFTAIGVSGTDWSKSFVPPASPIPEPAAIALFGAGLVGLGFARRRGESKPRLARRPTRRPGIARSVLHHRRAREKRASRAVSYWIPALRFALAGMTVCVKGGGTKARAP
jgi:hypothetical protein